jgi:hypothetical protein
MDSSFVGPAARAIADRAHGGAVPGSEASTVRGTGEFIRGRDTRSVRPPAQKGSPHPLRSDELAMKLVAALRRMAGKLLFDEDRGQLR